MSIRFALGLVGGVIVGYSAGKWVARNDVERKIEAVQSALAGGGPEAQAALQNLLAEAARTSNPGCVCVDSSSMGAPISGMLFSPGQRQLASAYYAGLQKPQTIGYEQLLALSSYPSYLPVTSGPIIRGY